MRIALAIVMTSFLMGAMLTPAQAQPFFIENSLQGKAAPELMGKLAPLIQLALGKRLGGGVAPSKPSSPTNGHAK